MGTFARDMYGSMNLSRVEIDAGSRGAVGSVFFIIEDVPSTYKNAYGMVHRGALMSYVDISTTCALYGFDYEQTRAQKSRQINVEFFDNFEVKPENPMLIEARINKLEDDYAYMFAEMTQMRTGRIVVQGTHHKAFIKDHENPLKS